MKTFFVSFLVFCFQFSVFSAGAHASFDFPSQYDITYTYSQDHDTKVHQKIILTNRFSQLHPTSFRLEIIGDPPTNITARDSGGPLKFQILNQTDNQTVVEFKFNRPVVGRGKSYSFDVYYEVPPAKEISSLWEIPLPQLGNIDPNDTNKFHLLIPNSMGPLVSSDPAPTSTNNTSHPGFVHLQYNSQDLKTKTGLATFGFAILPPKIEVLYPLQIFPPFVTSIRLEITNPNHFALDPQDITLSSTNLPLTSNIISIPSLYPDQKTILDVPVQRFFVPQLQPKTLTLQVGRDQIPYNISGYLFIAWYVTFVITVASTLAYCGFTAHKAGSVHLQKRKG